MGAEKEHLHSYQYALNWGKQQPGPKEQNVPARILLYLMSGDTRSCIGRRGSASRGGGIALVRGVSGVEVRNKGKRYN